MFEAFKAFEAFEGQMMRLMPPGPRYWKSDWSGCRILDIGGRSLSLDRVRCGSTVAFLQ